MQVTLYSSTNQRTNLLQLWVLQCFHSFDSKNCGPGKTSLPDWWLEHRIYGKPSARRHPSWQVWIPKQWCFVLNKKRVQHQKIRNKKISQKHHIYIYIYIYLCVYIYIHIYIRFPVETPGVHVPPGVTGHPRRWHCEARNTGHLELMWELMEEVSWFWIIYYT